MSDTIHNVVIVGSGPAGLTAAIYASRASLNPVVITGRNQGGQLTTTPEIGNWPGAFQNPSGFELMDSMTKHAKNLNVEFLSDEVVSSDLEGEIKTLELSSGRKVKARTVIIATGANARYLGLESEEQYKGKGVSACATCDGFFYRGKDVAVVGGGSAAFVEAIFLGNLAKKVYLVHRRSEFRAEKIVIDRFNKLVEEGKAEYVLDARVTEIKGDGSVVTGVELDVKGEKRALDLQGVFVAIGHNPATAAFEGLKRDEVGYIETGFERETQTSIPGVFAAGDCADPVYRQAITSAGQGCKAALDAQHFLGL
ncbi:MAG: thioredoxin-disulfide reductase [Succinivibrio sp.]|nr:thioredoxin-disulfide reductase [Succinivibrio sp.]